MDSDPDFAVQLACQAADLLLAHFERTTPFFTCCSRTYRRYQVGVPYKARILGSSANNFCCVARGIAL